MSEENKVALRRFINEVYSKGNASVVDDLVDANFVDHSPIPGQASGPEGVKQGMTMFRSAFPDLQLTIEDMIAEGDKVVARMTARGTHQGEFMGIAPTGKQVSWNAFGINRYVDGKIKEHWGVPDLFGLMQQLGAIPAPKL